MVDFEAVLQNYVGTADALGMSMLSQEASVDVERAEEVVESCCSVVEEADQMSLAVEVLADILAGSSQGMSDKHGASDGAVTGPCVLSEVDRHRDSTARIAEEECA